MKRPTTTTMCGNKQQLNGEENFSCLSAMMILFCWFFIIIFFLKILLLMRPIRLCCNVARTSVIDFMSIMQQMARMCHGR
jgi:hypothetical protein